jgi:ferredoxin
MVGPGRVPCAPYESMWSAGSGRRIDEGVLMGAPAEAVSGVYRDLGLGLRTDAHELPDHLEPRATADAALVLRPPDSTFAVDARASPLGRLQIDPALRTVCGACATACPTGVLWQGDDDEGAAVLRHHPAACAACERRTEVCPESALGVRRGIDIAALRRGTRELARAQRELCAACGTELAPRQRRARVRELLGRPDLPLTLCASCARKPVAR